MNTSQRVRFLIGASLELIGIVVLAARYQALIGGTAPVVVGAVALALGLSLQLTALLAARKAANRD